MILVDTSVWIDHLRTGDSQLQQQLMSGLVACHPMVVGELALGSLKARAQVLELLQALPTLPQADHQEVLFMIERQQLMGRGIGLIDAHLLASVMLQPAAKLWTRDKRLAAIALELGCAWMDAVH